MTLAWFLTPIGRKVGLGILIAVVLGAVIWKAKSAWKEQGKEETRAEVTEAAATNVVQDAHTVAQGSQARQPGIVASQAQVESLKADVASLRQELTQGRSRVEQMPAASIHAYVIAELKLRESGDASPGYTEPEEKEIAVRVTAYPRQAESIEKLNRALGEKEKESILLAEDAKDWKDAHGRLLRDYTTLYNTYPHKHRSWKCWATGRFWTKCVDKKLSVPSPAEIR